jgi:hypothetical protein
MLARIEIYFLMITLPLAVIFGIQGYYAGGEGFLGKTEVVFEFLNMVLALVAAIFSFNVARRFGMDARGGASWRWFAIATFMFSLAEFSSILSHLKIFEVEGLYEFLEFAFFVALSLGFNAQKQLITDIIQVLAKRIPGERNGQLH